MTSPKREIGLKQVYATPDVDITAEYADIIAIHGFDTESPSTWTWRPLDGSPQVNWLQDSRMLPSQVGKNARIFTFEWPANVFCKSESLPWTLTECARLLLASIRDMRQPSSVGMKRVGRYRPLIFVASCFGGIILMEALVLASRSSTTTNDQDGEYDFIRQATRGIVFLSTPFRGTAYCDIATWAFPLLQTRAFLTDQNVTTLLNSVEGPGGTGVEELISTFTRLCLDEQFPIEVQSFYETQKTALLSSVLLPRWVRSRLPRWARSLLPAGSKQLVDRSSATLDIVQNPVPFDRPHIAMNKFWGPDDPYYRLVVGTIKEILLKPSTLDEADWWIRERCYTEDRLRIERLSGDTLPMNRCYINLSIVGRKPGIEGTMACHSNQFASPGLSVGTKPTSAFVRLPHIFDKRDELPGPTRRVMIEGLAGVGKTTLCKKMIHDFIHDDLWNDLFDRVLWVPLRRLRNRGTPGYNLENVLVDEFFSQCRQGPALARAMRRVVDDELGRKTLFVLDGLDEVAQHLHPDEAMFSILRDLLDRENVIVTSRPFGIGHFSSSIRPFDLQLQTVGFSKEEVQEYIRSSFIDNLGTVAEIERFLEERDVIQDVVRIPIQLDALCYAWRDGSFRAGINTASMTAMYQGIEQLLWKKDVLRLEKRHEGQTLRIRDVQDAPPSEIMGYVDAEMRFLEFLAFTGLHNGVIEFSFAHRDAVYRVMALSALPPPHRVLSRLSFLRTSDPVSRPGRDNHSHQSYHFLHLTYQEYFAALYFVRHWEAGQSLQCLSFTNGGVEPLEPTVLLQRHKYRPRFEIVWCFVVGLLRQEKAVVEFLAAIDTPPIDLLGPVHRRLLMRCLRELVVPDDSQSTLGTLRARMEQNLLRWFRYACARWSRSQQVARFGLEPDFPKHIIRAVLQDRELHQTHPGMLAFGRMRGPAATARNASLVDWLKEGGIEEAKAILAAGKEDVRSYQAFQVIIEALRGRTDLTDDIALFILEDCLLVSVDEDYKAGLLEILEGQQSLSKRVKEMVEAATKQLAPTLTVLKQWPSHLSQPEGIFEAVQRFIKEVVEVRGESLYGYLKPSPEIFHAVLTCLGDDHNPSVCLGALMVLAKYGSEFKNLYRVDDMIQAVVACLNRPKCSIRIKSAALYALKQFSQELPNNVVHTVINYLGESSSYLKSAVLSVLRLWDVADDPCSLNRIKMMLSRAEDETEPDGMRIGVLGALAELTRQKSLPTEILERLAGPNSPWGHVYSGLSSPEASRLIFQILCLQDRPNPQLFQSKVFSKMDFGSACILDDLCEGGARNLPVDILESVAQRLQELVDLKEPSDSKDFRDANLRKAYRILGRQLTLPKSIWLMLAGQLSRNCFDTNEILRGIFSQRTEELPAEAFDMIVAYLHESEDHYRHWFSSFTGDIKAAEALFSREGLPHGLAYQIWLDWAFEGPVRLMHGEGGCLILHALNKVLTVPEAAGKKILAAREKVLREAGLFEMFGDDQITQADTPRLTCSTRLFFSNPSSHASTLLVTNFMLNPHPITSTSLSNTI